MQHSIIRAVMGFTALSAVCGVVLHDTNIDKAAVHSLSRSDSGHDVSVSTHPHTHSEHKNEIKGKAHAARDPRDDKLKHFDAVKLMKLLTPDEDSNILQLPENL